MKKSSVFWEDAARISVYYRVIERLENKLLRAASIVHFFVLFGIGYVDPLFLIPATHFSFDTAVYSLLPSLIVFCICSFPPLFRSLLVLMITFISLVREKVCSSHSSASFSLCPTTSDLRNKSLSDVSCSTSLLAINFSYAYQVFFPGMDRGGSSFNLSFRESQVCCLLSL